MKLFQTSTGIVVSAGFNMQERKPDPYVISWDDGCGNWDMLSSGAAGWNKFSIPIVPEFVRETSGAVVLFRSGLCVEMRYVGAPVVWHFTLLRSDDEVHTSTYIPQAGPILSFDGTPIRF